MKVKTSELIGDALDWAVATALGWKRFPSDFTGLAGVWCKDPDNAPLGPTVPVIDFSPSTNWSQGGPLIERYKIDVFKAPSNFVEKWAAYCEPPMQQGPSPLAAAMRTIVAAKFGDEVEVPDELLA